MKAVAERTLLRIGAVSATLGIITFFVAREGFLFTLAQATPWFCADADFCAKPGTPRPQEACTRTGTTRADELDVAAKKGTDADSRGGWPPPSKSGRPRETC